MTLSVREAGLADADAIAPLFDGYRQFYRQPTDLPLALAFIKERLSLRESVILLAEDADGSVVGFTQLYPSFSSIDARRIWILEDLFVLPAYRGKHVGRALLNAAKAYAAATGAKRLTLSTAQDNPAQHLYESIGYVRDTTFFHYSLTLD